MANTPNDIFEENLQKFTQDADKATKKHNVISLIRVVYFVAFLAVIIYLANIRDAGSMFVALFVGLAFFFVMVKWHQKVAYLRDYCLNLVKINSSEKLRAEGKLKEIEGEGNEFSTQDHPYIFDLDIFGKSSLFKLLNRTVSTGGTVLLAKWLKGPAPKDEVYRRQEAVKELTDQVGFRQEFQAKGMFTLGKNEDIEQLIAWVGHKSEIANKSWVVVAAYIFPLLMLSSILLYILLDLPKLVVALPLLLNIGLISMFAKTVTQMCEETVKAAKILKTYRDLFKHVEKHQFKSSKLIELQGIFHQSDKDASDAIKQVSRTLTNLEARQNIYFFITINILLAYEVFWAVKLEKWREAHREDLESWLDALSEFDVLNSLAGFSFTNPNYTMPVIVERDFIFRGSGLGHPLIHEKERVCNDFNLSGQGKAIIITGSNMSGKSTFLRTLGVNAVLAFAGAPVCASSLEISILQVFTSMRIQDSLEENTSAFYAELKRIKLLIEEIGKGKKVFFLLDEVLKGTNSQDRHLGVKAIISQLIKKPSFGLLSTHDLDLSRLADDYREHLTNLSFNSAIINDQLHFDYKVSEGICHSFSASKLMERLGILGSGDKEQ